jgi:hypothetical protein
VAEICSDCNGGAEPLIGETDSQLESLAAVKESVPLPVFETVTFVGTGFAPLPWVALKANAVVETDNTGCGGGVDPAGVTLSAQIHPKSMRPVPLSYVSVNKLPSIGATSYQPEEQGGVVVEPFTILRASKTVPGLIWLIVR